MQQAKRTCDRGCLKGRPKCDQCIHDASQSSAHGDIQSVVDAVSGATWNTRNKIMEGLFFEQLAEAPDDVPSYRPPGSL